MKRILQSFFALSLMLMASTAAFAQLPDGSTAPNIIKEDINGNEHNMYSWLADGYTVILDFSATWCGPCWDYHTGGTLEEVWANHGPAGWDGVLETTTDDVMIFFIEGDDATTLADLEGTGGNTAGDWVTGTMYPIIDDAGDAFSEYQCTYFPTMYTICPDRICVESGQISVDQHYTIAENCTQVSIDDDAGLYSYSGGLLSCGTVAASVELINNGLNDLTSADITMTGCEDCPITMPWTGSLGLYEQETVEFGDVAVGAPVTFDFELTASDEDASNNTVSQGIAVATVATTWWSVALEFDCWSEECSWTVTDDMGNIVVESDPYAAGETSAFSNFELPSTGCYIFNLYDSYGDGMMGSQWDACDIDGVATVSSASGVILSYDGSYNYGQLVAGANANVVSIDEARANAVGMNVYPNPFSDVTTLEFTVANNAAVTMEVINMLGEVVMANDYGTLSNGSHRTELDFTSIEAGLYFVNLNVDGATTTTKVTLTK